jgi:Ca-activated chloride channel family protein
MDRVHRRIGAPAVTDLELEADGLQADLDSIAPRRLPALYAGAPLVVCGRYSGPPDGALTVRGRDAAGRPWSARAPAVPTAAPAVTSVWARAHLRDLEDRYASEQRADRDLEGRIVETSLRFGVLCRFTAFVAADLQVVNQGGAVHRVVQPVEPPAGWDMFQHAELAAMPLARMTTAPAGGLLSVAPEPGRAAGPLGKVAGRLRAGQGGPGLPRLGGSRLHPLGGKELGPYRRRARRLASLLQSDGPELGGRLGLVRVGLAALVADLESVDAVEAELRPLRELAAALDRLDRLPPGAAELARLRRRVLAGLEAFAAGAAAPSEPAPAAPAPAPQPAPRRPTAFWKR